MVASQAIDDDLAGMDDLGNEFYRHVDGIARQIGADDKPYFEFDRIDAFIASNAHRSRCKTRLKIDKRLLDFSGDIVDAGFVDRPVGDVRNAKIDDRFARIGRVGHVDGRFQRDGIEQVVYVAADFTPQHRFGDDVAWPQSPPSEDPLSVFVAEFDG